LIRDDLRNVRDFRVLHRKPGGLQVSTKEPTSISSVEAENRRLRRAVDELSFLNQLAADIGGTLDSQKILEKLVVRSLRAVHAEHGSIVLIQQKGKDPAKTLVRASYSSSHHPLYRLSDNMLEWVINNKRPLMVNSPGDDTRFAGEAWDARIRSFLSVPMMIKSQLIGVLTVYNKKHGELFTDDDQRLLAILASQSAQIVENARLYEEEQKLLRIQKEIRLAAEIQDHLLPDKPPFVPGYDIAGKSFPARNIGGDFFDFITIDETRLAICLGDVSGKGLPASLLMANLQATIRGQTHATASLKDCLRVSNKLLYQCSLPERFATVFYGVLNIDENTFRYANAGHHYPFLFSGRKTPRRLQTGGPALGFLDDASFDEEEVRLAPQDLLLIFSDGISDACVEGVEQFGEERLRTVVADNMDQPAAGLIEAIVEAVDVHCRQSPPPDDMTLVVVRNAAP